MSSNRVNNEVITGVKEVITGVKEVIKEVLKAFKGIGEVNLEVNAFKGKTLGILTPLLMYRPLSPPFLGNLYTRPSCMS